MKKFEDTLNTAVFTTKFIAKDNMGIACVTHDVEDKAWQFFCNDDFANFEEVAMIESLCERIQIDKTVLEIAACQ